MRILNRAKSFYSDEYFISQDIKFELEMMYLRVNGTWRECEQSTRSINFEDMIDIQGTKIFASLSEDGKGGDIVDLPDYLKAEKVTERAAVIIMKSFNEYKAFCKNGAIYGSSHFIENSKVIGIQE